MHGRPDRHGMHIRVEGGNGLTEKPRARQSSLASPWPRSAAGAYVRARCGPLLLLPVQLGPDGRRLRRVDIDVVELRLQPTSVELNLVRTDFECEPLKHTVEIVDHTRVVAVDVDSSVARLHHQAHVTVVDA